MLLIAGAILLAVLIVAAIVAIATTVSHRGSAVDDQGRRVNHVVTGPAPDGRDTATVDLVSGATSVTVRAADLGDHLYRVTTPVEGNGASAVVIELNRDVRWQLRFTAGASSESLDLRDVKLAGLEFVGGASSIDVTLGKPTGTLPIRQGGGVNRFAIHAPDGVPVRVTAGGGAGSITIDGAQHSGISAGTSFSSTGWDKATDRYDVINTVGVGSLLVDRVH
jgi:hypothetical protein